MTDKAKYLQNSSELGVENKQEVAIYQSITGGQADLSSPISGASFTPPIYFFI